LEHEVLPDNFAYPDKAWRNALALQVRLEACAQRRVSRFRRTLPQIDDLRAMQIDHYRFGHIDIEGRSYDADVIIFPNRVQERWRQREGHRLVQHDLGTVMAKRPEVLVVGTGYYGRMQVPEKTLDSLATAGIDVRVLKTDQAVAEFNRLQRECASIVAALHLTC
jgi:hypothetical protein